jgi:hypothetical protein
MTQVQWQYLESMIGDMSAADRDRLATMLSQAKTSEPASASSDPASQRGVNRSLGLFSDDPELVDELMRIVNFNREHQPLRTSDIAPDPLVGMLADEPELVDEIMDGVYHAREHHPLRLNES